MHTLTQRGNSLVLKCDVDRLAPVDESQLSFWGFRPEGDNGSYSCRTDSQVALAQKLITYFAAQDQPLQLSDALAGHMAVAATAVADLAAARERGAAIKAGTIRTEGTRPFLDFITARLARRLKPHQVKAALHLLQTANGANFSVPGSGKTSVVITVFEWLRNCGQVDALFVVGPPACFAPWLAEYEAVTGRAPQAEVVAGGDISSRHDKYRVTRESAPDLYLTTFQTLHRDLDHVMFLLGRQGIRFYLVIDEAHYVKQVGGAWSGAVQALAPCAARRCVLTGTPFPQSYTDAFSLFDILWPSAPPISDVQRLQLEQMGKQRDTQGAAELLDATIGPLFYRVRKSELNLAPQVHHPVISVTQKPLERQAYVAVVDGIRRLAQADYERDFTTLSRLQRGRMIRFRQCLSYTALLATAIEDYDEQFGPGDSLADYILHYDTLETPGKVDAVLGLVGGLVSDGEKVVVWSSFVRTLELLAGTFESAGIETGLIYGATPVQDRDVTDEATREEIIQRFTQQRGGYEVLVANPAACAESISLHKNCSHAVYYDLSYNCAQYIQSLDRIHRVGGSEDKQANYYYLQYDDTRENDILERVQTKARRMKQVIDRDYAIYALDMFSGNEELEAYARLFDR